MKPGRPTLALLGLLGLAGLAGLAVPGCDLARAPERPVPPGPNVLFVVVDTLRADRLSQYGHHRDTSGALALLSDAATRFDECYSPAPWTAPSVASMFTGLAPARHGVDAVGAALPKRATTLAQRLQRAGWRTAAVTFNPHVNREAGFHRGFDEFLGYRGLARRAPDVRRLTALALAWLDDLRRESSRPFFLFLQPMNVHGPYRVPDDARTKLLDRPPREGFEFFGPLMLELMNRGRIDRRAEVTPEMLASLEEKYDTAVRHTADELGAFFDALLARGLWEDTLVVLTSDHGEELFDHGGFAHRYSLHREVLHVPLLVKLPGQREARSVAEPVSLVDLRATIEDLLRLAPVPGDGRSLAPLLGGAGALEPAPAGLRQRAFLAQASNARRFVGRSLRIGNDQLIEIGRSYEGLQNAVRLYDLARDPRQQRDLAPLQPERVARLRALMDRLETSYRSQPLPSRSYEVDDELRTALEALGYL